MNKELFIKKVGENIRSTREEKKISLEKLAMEADIEYSQLSRIEKGKINTSIYSVFVIANALGVTLADLLTTVV